MKGQQTLFSSKSDEWETPQELFDALNKVFDFDLDVCATSENAKCGDYFGFDSDYPCGLTAQWGRGICWCNPPYSEISKWVDKALSETLAETVMLLPNRTCTKWWHKLNDHQAVKMYPIKGRLKFGNSKNSAPFPSVIVHIKFDRADDLLKTIARGDYVLD